MGILRFWSNSFFYWRVTIPKLIAIVGHSNLPYPDKTHGGDGHVCWTIGDLELLALDIFKILQPNSVCVNGAYGEQDLDDRSGSFQLGFHNQK